MVSHNAVCLPADSDASATLSPPKPSDVADFGAQLQPPKALMLILSSSVSAIIFVISYVR